MAECKERGRQIRFFEKVNDRCPDCSRAFMLRRQRERENGPELAAALEQDDARTEEEISRIILTTEFGHDLEVIERIEIVSAECAYGLNLFKDLFAGVRDVVGGRSKAVQNAMREARRTTLMELKREAHAVGANAVVGVDLDYVELSSAGNMLMLVASGTAVRAKLE